MTLSKKPFFFALYKTSIWSTSNVLKWLRASINDVQARRHTSILLRSFSYGWGHEALEAEKMYPCCWKIECSSLENLSGSSFPRESFPFPRSNFPFSRSVRSRKRKIRSRKWKALSRKRNFAFKFFQLWAVSFRQHGTYIPSTRVIQPKKFSSQVPKSGLTFRYWMF